jgi:hypothetical protein
MAPCHGGSTFFFGDRPRISHKSNDLSWPSSWFMVDHENLLLLLLYKEKKNIYKYMHLIL